MLWIKLYLLLVQVENSLLGRAKEEIHLNFK